MDLGEDNMLRHLMEYGSGVHWATRKESADIYVDNRKFGYDSFFGAKSLLLTGYARLSDVDWFETFDMRIVYPEERELILWRPIRISAVEVYDITQRAREALVEWKTTGKNWKPWIDPKFRPENVYKYPKPMVKVSTPIQNPPENRTDIMPGIKLDNPGELGYAHAKPSLDDLFPGAAKVAPYYMRSQTIPITALQNGGEWRHGNFAEEDPFSEYFE